MSEPSDGRQPLPGVALVLLLFAGVDLILALALLVVGGFSWQFAGIAAIGVALAAYGLKLVYFPPPPRP